MPIYPPLAATWQLGNLTIWQFGNVLDGSPCRVQQPVATALGPGARVPAAAAVSFGDRAPRQHFNQGDQRFAVLVDKVVGNSFQRGPHHARVQPGPQGFVRLTQLRLFLFGQFVPLAAGGRHSRKVVARGTTRGITLLATTLFAPFHTGHFVLIDVRLFRPARFHVRFRQRAHLFVRVQLRGFHGFGVNAQFFVPVPHQTPGAGKEEQKVVGGLVMVGNGCE